MPDTLVCGCTAWIGPVIGVIVGFTLNLVYQYLREVWSSPSLTIDCQQAARRIGEGPDNVYMKFRVRNKRRRSVARNCRAYLIAIHHVSNNKVITDNLKPDGAQLPWEGGGFEPRDIPYGHSQYGDIVHFSKHEPGWIFFAKPNYITRDIKLKEYRGTLRVSVLVACDGAKPKTKNIYVDYNGDWNNAKPYDA